MQDGPDDPWLEADFREAFEREFYADLEMYDDATELDFNEDPPQARPGEESDN
jgi:hypothetical protein